MIHPPELWRLLAETSSSEAGETWREMVMKIQWQEKLKTYDLLTDNGNGSDVLYADSRAEISK
jgi:hypothetical protein